MLDQIDLKEEEKLALATIIRVEGSSYRSEGAKMLFWEDGRKFGTISAGCLEEDLYVHSLAVMNTFQGKKVIYDLAAEDDLTWGVGCNGLIEIYIEPIIYGHYLKVLKNNLLGGRKTISAKCLKYDTLPLNGLFSTDGKLLGGDFELNLVRDLIPAIEQFIKTGKKIEIVTFQGFEYLLEKNNPKCLLYIFGAGNDAEPLTELASGLGFSVTIIDPRESRCTKDYFPTADAFVVEHPDHFFQHNNLNDYCFIIIMNHHFDRDRQVLEHLTLQSPAYIGILGSRKRTERLLNQLKKTMDHSVHYPIGLNINAEGPEEISVSIMAEIIQIRHQLMGA
jgi:xanthine dehydrogenase accessory factor